MPLTEAAKKHLVSLAEQDVMAPGKLRKEKTTTKQTPKPKKPAVKRVQNMSTLVSALRVAVTGDAGVGPARLKTIHVVTGGGLGRVTITNGNGGATLFDADFLATDVTCISFPDEGIRFSEGMFVSVLTNITSVTLIYA